MALRIVDAGAPVEDPIGIVECRRGVYRITSDVDLEWRIASDNGWSGLYGYLRQLFFCPVCLDFRRTCGPPEIVVVFVVGRRSVVDVLACEKIRGSQLGVVGGFNGVGRSRCLDALVNACLRGVRTWLIGFGIDCIRNNSNRHRSRVTSSVGHARRRWSRVGFLFTSDVYRGGLAHHGGAMLDTPP